MLEMRPLRLFPRSLRQLVLLAFILILLPLLILAYQAYKSLDNLSSQAAEINHTTLTDVRRSEAMTGIALEMERSYRQYCVLKDPSLRELYNNRYKQYLNMLDAQASILPAITYYEKLNDLLTQLTTIQCTQSQPSDKTNALLGEFSETNTSLATETREVIFSRGQMLQKAIAERGRYFGWQSLMLFLVSLILVFLFTRMIIGPVKGIERMITRLGAGKKLRADVFFKGPTELRSLAQSIIWLSERLTWLESQRHEFLRHISHELKTPLASMREGTELLADGVAGVLTHEQQEVVEILNNSSRHLQQLIEQLLDYNRRLLNKSITKEPINLSHLMGEIILAHSITAKMKSMTTSCQFDTNECWAEAALLTTVIDNLYSNAVYYGKEFGNIWIYCRRLSEVIQIDIANTGIPISAIEQEMVFEPFFQGEQQRKGAVKGTGLGLSIARDCVRRMSGDLQLIIVEYADVCFRIQLPIKNEN